MCVVRKSPIILCTCSYPGYCDSGRVYLGLTHEGHLVAEYSSNWHYSTRLWFQTGTSSVRLCWFIYRATGTLKGLSSTIVCPKPLMACRTMGFQTTNGMQEYRVQDKKRSLQKANFFILHIAIIFWTTNILFMCEIFRKHICRSIWISVFSQYSWKLKHDHILNMTLCSYLQICNDRHTMSMPRVKSMFQ